MNHDRLVDTLIVLGFVAMMLIVLVDPDPATMWVNSYVIH